MKLKRYQVKHLNKEKKRRGFSTSALIVYLLIAVTLTTGVSFSRYTSTASGSDSARVAKFGVTASVENTAITVNSPNGEGGSAKINVTNSSEVVIAYEVVVTLPKTLTSGMNLTLDGVNVTPSGNVYTFPVSGNLGIGSTNEHNLTVTLTSGTPFAEDTFDGINVAVNAVQVD